MRRSSGIPTLTFGTHPSGKTGLDRAAGANEGCVGTAQDPRDQGAVLYAREAMDVISGSGTIGSEIRSSNRRDLLDRMVRAVEKVRDRLHRAAAALEAAGVLYAVVGGNAVASWVARVDEAAVRNTQDVDILLIARTSRPRSKAGEGRLRLPPRQRDRHVPRRTGCQGARRRPCPLRGREGSVRRPGGRSADRRVGIDRFFRVVALESLLRMKLTSFRRKDQVHIVDMIDVGLVDESWLTGSRPRSLRD